MCGENKLGSDGCIRISEEVHKPIYKRFMKACFQFITDENLTFAYDVYQRADEFQ